MCRKSLVKSLNTSSLKANFFNKEGREIIIRGYNESGVAIGTMLTDISPFSHPSDIMDKMVDAVQNTAKSFNACGTFKIHVVDSEDATYDIVLAEVTRSDI